MQRTILTMIMLACCGCSTKLHYNPDTGFVDVDIPVWGRKFDKLQVTRLDDGSVDLVISNYGMEGVDTVIHAVVKAAIEASIK